jgi:hypothetical protein
MQSGEDILAYTAAAIPVLVIQACRIDKHYYHKLHFSSHYRQQRCRLPLQPTHK